MKIFGGNLYTFCLCHLFYNSVHTQNIGELVRYSNKKSHVDHLKLSQVLTYI